MNKTTPHMKWTVSLESDCSVLQVFLDWGIRPRSRYVRLLHQQPLPEMGDQSCHQLHRAGRDIRYRHSFSGAHDL